MFEGSPYFPAFSTRAHEQLAYSKCPDDVKDGMVPIVTLTRYGKAETLLETADVLLSDLRGRTAIVDFDPEPRATTSEEQASERRRRKAEARAAKGEQPTRPRTIKQLAREGEDRGRTEAFNRHVGELTDPRGGAARWIDMISDVEALVPIVQMSGPIPPQLDILRRKGRRGALRISPGRLEHTDAFFENIGAVRSSADALVLIVDFQDIRARFTAAVSAATEFYSRLYEGLGDDADSLETVLLSNSFPRPPLRDVSRELEIEDLRFHREISRTFDTKYGDYMSIPPRRSSAVAANGWLPHVDLVAKTRWHVCLYESNRDETKYIEASQALVEGPHWRTREECWGTSIIEQVAATGRLRIDGRSFTTPAPWLTVRANQHITQMALSR